MQGWSRRSALLLSIDDLRVAYGGRSGPVKAVRGVSLEVARGMTLGVVGESGCGKTTLARAVLRLLPSGTAVGGRILLDGVDLLGLAENEMRHVRGRRIALVPQGSMSSLDPVLRIGDQLAEPLVVHRSLERRHARERAAELLELVGLDPGLAGSYPHELSGGMRQRAVVAMALAADPELLIADEPTTGLDVVTQAQILRLLLRLRAELGLTLVLISHDLRAVLAACDQVTVMYAGRAVESGDGERLGRHPRHPYSAALLAALPNLESGARRWQSIPGTVPQPGRLPGGCAFHPRCPLAIAACATTDPQNRQRPGGSVACVLYDDPGRQDIDPPVLGSPWPALPPRCGTDSHLLEVTGLAKTFRRRAGRRRRDAPALTDVDLVVDRGEAVGVIGQSGSGKSTLARCIVGLVRPAAGRISFDGTAVLDVHGTALSDYRRRVSIVHQDPYGSLHPGMTVKAIVAEPLRIRGVRHSLVPRVAAALEAAELAPTAEFLDLRSTQLSGGQRQRVAIARALICDPELLIADEPTSMLDVSLRASILETLQRLRLERDLSILLVTHDLAEVVYLCDTVYVLLAGRVVETGPTTALLERPRHEHTRALVAASRDQLKEG